MTVRGTALGDSFSDDSAGLLRAAIVFAAMLALVATAYFRTGFGAPDGCFRTKVFSHLFSVPSSLIMTESCQPKTPR